MCVTRKPLIAFISNWQKPFTLLLKLVVLIGNKTEDSVPTGPPGVDYLGWKRNTM